LWRAGVAVCLVNGLTAALSCHGPLPGDPSRALPGRIQLTGSQQSAVVGTAVTTPPSLQVWSRGGEPMPNLRVVFAVTGGGGVVTAATVSTDLDGVAAVGSWTLGTQTGPNALMATVSEVDTVLVFTAMGTPGAPTAITKVVGDTQTTTVGTLVSVAPMVRVADQHDNAVPRVGVTFAVVSGGGSATGGSVATDTAGRAAVGSWRLGAQGGAHTLSASVDSAAGVSTTFTATALPPAKVAFVVQPSGVVAGAAMSPAVQVAVQDARGNTVAIATDSITLTITTGTGTAGATLGGTLTRAAVNGVATFAGLTLDKAGTGYTFTASAAGLTAATSSAFAVTPGTANRLMFTVQPSSVAAGAAVAPAVQVAVQDTLGNTVTSSTASITLAITSGTGVAGATLGGTRTRAAVSGVATFADLTLDKAGTGYTLTASASGFAAGTSVPFAVRHGPARSIVSVSGNGQTGPAASALPAPFVVVVRDSLGNAVDSVRVAFRVTVGGGKLAGQDSQVVFTDTLGTASATLTLGATTATNTVTATSTGLTGSPVTFTATIAPASVTVTPASVTLTGVGSTTTLTAQAFDSVGTAISGVTFTWTSSATSVATVSSSGLVTAVGVGTATITATAPGGASGSGTVSVRLVAAQQETRLSAANDHTCEITTGGAALCWGSNSFGQLGDGTTIERTIPVAVSGGLVFQAISGGPYHTCALTTGGVAYCWGNNTYGQLGDGTTANHSSPAAVSGGLVFQAISAGQSQTCALTTGGAAYCWGDNDSGELGDGTTTGRPNPTAVLSAGLVFQTISAGQNHTCGLTTDGAAYCWGLNFDGQLGDGTASARYGPVAVAGGLAFQAISTGYSHTCGLTTGGAAYCWGWNPYGQLGDGTTSDRASPVSVAGGRVFQAISGGGSHTCGLSASGDAYCWGWNFDGQLGDGTTNETRTIPVAVSGGLVLQAISAGGGHTCGLTTSGTAYCWGRNIQGALGDGTTTGRRSPVAVSAAATKLAFTVQPTGVVAGTALAPAVRVTVQDAQGNTVIGATTSVTLAIASGTGTTGAVLGGTLTQAAVNGVATFTDLTIDKAGTGYVLTAAATSLTGATSSGFAVTSGTVTISAQNARLGAGSFHTCGLTVGGVAYCWGYNPYGQLGVNTGTSPRLSPVAVSGGLLFQAISTGSYHGCGLTTTGAPYCWGRNEYGQLGDGTLSNSTSPLAVSGGLVFQTISGGYQHTCGLTAGGVAYCWGSNEFSQLGDGTGTARTSPVAVSGGLAFQTISTGYMHTCGLTATGAAYCWGFNGYGQLGTSSGNPTSPVAVSGGLVFQAISAFAVHTCGLSTDGAAYCWGSNEYGQLGDGTTSNRTSPVAVLGGLVFQAISVNYRHTCGLTTGGAAYCWGYNANYGQLGDGTTIDRASPVAVSGGLVFQSISTGETHTCGLSTGGATYCWGHNGFGQLGDGTGVDHWGPVPVSAPTATLAFSSAPSSNVVAGSAFTATVEARDVFGNLATGFSGSVTLAITSGTGTGGAVLGGTLTRAASAGVATFSGLALDRAGTGYTLTASATGLTSATSSAFTVTPGTVIVSQQETRLTAGSYHTCALTTGGTASCWGSNLYGQLGDGTSSNRNSPVAVSGGLVFQAISGGRYRTCALTMAGAAYCWGENSSGQLGDGTTTNRTSPVAVSGGLVFQALSAGTNHTCGLTTGGTAYCWGYNVWGQLGDGTTGIDRTSPVAVSGGLIFQAISGGEYHTCGLTTGGAAYCWGWNGYGQLGDGTLSTRTSPVAVSGGLVFQAISVGYNQTCGLTTSGAAYCWGYNGFGLLGDGTLSSRYSPVPVSGGLALNAISGGAFHTCGLNTAGAVYCWGYNSSGQLGDGTTVQYSSSPVAVTGGLVFQSTSAGSSHTCALATGGAIYCWGSNGDGQVGDGTTTDRTIPVAVTGGIGQFALEFTQSYVSLADNDALDLNTSWTLEAWVYPTQVAGANQDVISKWGVGGHASYGLAIGSTGRLNVGTHDGTVSVVVNGRTPLVTAAWQHIAATFDNGTVRIYLNGVLDTTVSGVPAPMNSTSELAFGREGVYAAYTFGGVMDEVRIWNVVRSAADITAFRSSRLVGNEVGLVGYWRFDEGAGDTAFDATGRGNHGRLGTAVGTDAWDPRWTTNTAPIQ
jgi:alpha-tubulin suppressor-like RCC1 family protein